LYRLGFPSQRLYLLLGLLGFYQSDIGSLTKDEIMPHDGMLALLHENGWNEDDIAAMRAVSESSDWFICRFRNKTSQWGCWLLWPETLAILRKLEAKDNTKGKDGTNLQLLGSKGNPLWHWSKGKTDAIRQHWEKLLDRYDGPRLTLKYLRKTGANLIIKYLPKQSETDRLAQTLMAQAEDENSKSTVARRNYLNSDFAILTVALRKLHDYLQPVFCGVPATGGSVFKKEKMQALAAAGLKIE
jgi:hypothetical protein